MIADILSSNLFEKKELHIFWLLGGKYLCYQALKKQNNIIIFISGRRV
jgi:hypothetical protein